jgi:hypothetical protein
MATDKPNTSDKPAEKPVDKAVDAHDGAAASRRLLDDAHGHSPEAKTEPKAQKSADELAKTADIKEVAEAIRKATGNDNWVARWADSDKIIDLLKHRSAAEREAIDKVYRQNYHVGLKDEMHGFMTGATRARFDAAMDRKDNDPVSSASHRMEVAFKESKQLIFGRSQSTLEQDLKDSMRELSPQQVAAVARDYEARNGKSLRQEIKDDSSLSPATRTALNAYLDRAQNVDGKPDKDNAGEIARVAGAALQNKDIKLFAETMASAGQEGRKQFAESPAGRDLAKHFSGDELERARDYMQLGKLSVAKQVKDNTGWLWDNNDGIELALKRMSDRERSDYLIGESLADRTKQLGDADSARLASMTDTDKAAARQSYDDIHLALDKAGNSTEVAKWESMIATRDGGVAAKLAEQRGWFGNGSVEDIKKSIDTMSESDWQSAKANSVEQRQELRQMLVSLNKDEHEIDDVMKSFDKKIAHDTFADSNLGPRQKPIQKLLEEMKAQDEEWFTDKAQAVRQMRDAFVADPTLKDRLNAPQTDEDRYYKAQFQKYGKSILGEDGYREYAGELLKTGNLSADKIIAFDKGVFSDDEESTYKNVAALAQGERQRLVGNKDYQDRVLGHLNDSERAIALQVAKSGKFADDDRLRSAIVGFGGGKDIVQIIQDTPPKDLDALRQSYASKYGTSLDSDLRDKLNNQEMAEVRRHELSESSITERLDNARDEQYTTRDGIGARLTDTMSATGVQADDSMRELLANPQGNDKLFENYAKAIDNHRESKAKAGEYSTDAIIAGAAVASVIATGGTNLPLVAAVLAAGGAAGKVGAKSVMMGNDYDWSLANVGQDAAVGAVTGATSVLGQGQIAGVFGIGRSAAERASVGVLGKLASEPGLLVANSETIMHQGTRTVMRDLLANGATKIDDKAFSVLANKLVSTELVGQARAQAVQRVQTEIAGEMTKQFANETANWLVHQGRSQALNALAGAVGGASSGSIEGAAQWDSRKSVADNLESIAARTGVSSLSGAFGAVAIGGAVHGAQHGIGSMSQRFKITDIKNIGFDYKAPVEGLKAANDNNFGPKVFDFKVKAANDNFVPPTEPMLMAVNDVPGYEPRHINAGDEGQLYRGPGDNITRLMSGADDQRPRLAAIGDGKPMPGEQHAGTIKPVSDVEPAVESPSPKDHGVKQFVETHQEDLQRVKAALDKQVDHLIEDIASRKAHLEDHLNWIEANKANKDKDVVAYGELVAMAGEKPSVIPDNAFLLRMREANGDTQRFVRDRMAESRVNFDYSKFIRESKTHWVPNEKIKGLSPEERAKEFGKLVSKFEGGEIRELTMPRQFGDRYEYAMNRMLNRLFNYPSKHSLEPWHVSDITRADRGLAAFDPRDYVYIPGTKGSALDHSKMDGLFVNIKEGKVVPIDIKATSYAEETSGQAAHGAAQYMKIYPGSARSNDRTIEFSKTGEPRAVAPNGRGERYPKDVFDKIFNVNGDFILHPELRDLKERLGSAILAANKYATRIADLPPGVFPSGDVNATTAQKLASVDAYATHLLKSSNTVQKEYGKSLRHSRPGIEKGLEADAKNADYHDPVLINVRAERSAVIKSTDMDQKMIKATDDAVRMAQELGVPASFREMADMTGGLKEMDEMMDAFIKDALLDRAVSHWDQRLQPSTPEELDAVEAVIRRGQSPNDQQKKIFVDLVERVLRTETARGVARVGVPANALPTNVMPTVNVGASAGVNQNPRQRAVSIADGFARVKEGL